MAEFNRNQNGVFGEIKLNGNNNQADTTSFFEGTMVNSNTNYSKENAGIFGDFANVEENCSNGKANESTVCNGTTCDGKTCGNTSCDIYGTKCDNSNIYHETPFQPIQQDKAITKQGLWTKVKAFLFQEIDLYAPIKVELTPYQQKVEDEINEFLHQEVSFKGIVNFFKGKNKKTC